MVHRLVILALLVGGPAFAQDADPQPVSVQTPALQTIGHERLRLAERGFVASGDPVVRETSAQGEVILRAPYRLSREGRLAADIATPFLRMKAGAPVAGLRFLPSNTQLAEPIHAWCGPGEAKDLILSWGAHIVCMVETSPGKAMLVTPLHHPVSWWEVSALSDLGRPPETDRVEVLPPETPTAFELVLINQRERNDSLTLRSQIIGPHVQPDKIARGITHNRSIPRSGENYDVFYDGLHLTLTPSEDAARLNVASARVQVPIDVSYVSVLPSQASEEEAQEPADAQSLGPTPYVIGALRFDPANMSAQTGVIGRNGTLVTGQAQYAVTGRLAKPLLIGGSIFTETVEAGAVLHQLEAFSKTRFGTLKANLLWCGPIGPGTIFSSKTRNQCILHGTRGSLEANFPSNSPSWLATNDRMDLAYHGLEVRNFQIEVLENSPLDPLDISIRLHRVTSTEAIIRVIATKDGDEAMVYELKAPFVGAQVTFPLWSHQLVLTQSGNGVTAELTEDGDGTSPVLWDPAATT